MERYSYRIISLQNAIATALLIVALLYVVFGMIGIVSARAWWALLLVVPGAVFLVWLMLPCVRALRVEAIFGPGGVTCHQGANTWRLSWRDVDSFDIRPGRLLVYPRPGARPSLPRGGYRVSAYLYSNDATKAPREALYVPLRGDQRGLVFMVLRRYLDPLRGAPPA